MYLFDLDGTLIDSNGIWAEVDRTFLARRGYPYTKEYYEGVAHTIFPLAAVFIVPHSVPLSRPPQKDSRLLMLPAMVARILLAPWVRLGWLPIPCTKLCRPLAEAGGKTGPILKSFRLARLPPLRRQAVWRPALQEGWQRSSGTLSQPAI